ncbi:MAG: helicase C-terminal domain-containing protein [Chloroflexota bacterium]
MQTLVALDLETTGLDPTRDAIIEIGAVRFRDDRVEQEWSQLVNPGRPLPSFITQLTGISDEMLAEAPRINQVLEPLAAFVGDHPIVGHQIAFDLSFLQRRGLFNHNQPLDTYDLAAVVLPAAGRYSLAALASELRVPRRASHRALEDARTTMLVFERLVELVFELPYPILRVLSEFGAHTEWGAGWVFEAALESRTEEDQGARLEFPALAPPTDRLEPLQPKKAPEPLDREALAALLQPGGAFSQAFPGYEHRSQQVQMLEAVAKALSESGHLLVEAGTGTGKSMAYLIPSVEWAARNGERVLVSTNTINLQDQLIHKDFPDLNRALGSDYRAAVLKGRRNYLCPRRLSAASRLGPRNPEEARVFAKVLVWLNAGGTGDVSEINLRGPAEAAIWSRMSSDYEECSLEACLEHTGGTCPYYKARLAAESAHVVIVNHALLLADIGTGNRVIPDYQYLIVDEGHQLEAATTRGLAFEVAESDLHRIIQDLEGGGQRFSPASVEASLPPERRAELRSLVAASAEKAREAARLIGPFFLRLLDFMERRRDGQPLSRYGQQERILPSTRSLPFWSEVEIGWDELRSPLSRLVEHLLQIGAAIEEPGEEDQAIGISTTVRDLAGILSSLDELIFQADPQRIFWIELQGEPARLSLHAAPLEVGPLIEKHLWHEKESVVVTSATLTTTGDFDYLRRRLGAVDADELSVGSPFDYESSAMLYLINDIPEPNQRQAYQAALEKGLIGLCRATGGRALVLFTSNEQLLTTARAISGPLGTEGIVVLEQTAGASRHALLESFKTTEQAVLLGTRSFWEGVDVPGEALSVLAFARLPFDVPSDPIIAARAETYEDSFNEYSLPEAILRFRQGFGRLIRTKSDRGVAVSFDRRLLSKGYGRAFLDSLPRPTQRIGPMADLPRQAAAWLGR